MIYNIYINLTDLILALLGRIGLRSTQIVSSPCTTHTSGTNFIKATFQKVTDSSWILCRQTQAVHHGGQLQICSAWGLRLKELKNGMSFTTAVFNWAQYIHSKFLSVCKVLCKHSPIFSLKLYLELAHMFKCEICKGLQIVTSID